MDDCLRFVARLLDGTLAANRSGITAVLMQGFAQVSGGCSSNKLFAYPHTLRVQRPPSSGIPEDHSNRVGQNGAHCPRSRNGSNTVRADTWI